MLHKQILSVYRPWYIKLFNVCPLVAELAIIELATEERYLRGAEQASNDIFAIAAWLYTAAKPLCSRNLKS